MSAHRATRHAVAALVWVGVALWMTASMAAAAAALPTTCGGLAAVADAALPPGYCAGIWAASAGVPRGMIADGSGGVLWVDRAAGSVVASWADDAEGNGEGGGGTIQRVTVVTEVGLSHGLALDARRQHLYASSADTVWRWNYAPDQRAPASGQMVMVRGMPTGGHSTRSLVLITTGGSDGGGGNGGQGKEASWLYVQVGSDANVDGRNETERSAVRALWLGAVADADSAAVPPGGVEWADLVPVAAGLRNTAGLGVHPLSGVVVGVDNGVDNLVDPAVGGDVHEDNPCEEVNVLPPPPSPPSLNVSRSPPPSYGYPVCWSEWRLPESSTAGVGSQHVWPSFRDEQQVDAAGAPLSTAWCRDGAGGDVAVNRPPAACLPAHWAPLGLTFAAAAPREGRYAPPAARNGSAEGVVLVTAHGSWNRAVPSGRLVAEVDLPSIVDGVGSGGAPSAVVSTYRVLFEQAAAAKAASGQWPIRPVDLAWVADGTLLVTSDASGEVLAVRYVGVGDPDDPSAVGAPTPVPDEQVDTPVGGVNGEQEGSVCFPPSATVLVRRRGAAAGAAAVQARLDSLAIGDAVLSPAGPALAPDAGDSAAGAPPPAAVWSPILAWTHKDATTPTAYVVLTAVGGAANDSVTLTLSGGHYVVVVKTSIAGSGGGGGGRRTTYLATARSVRVGDTLLTPTGGATVTTIGRTIRAGAFAPHPASGLLYVDSVAASAYTDAVHPAVAHGALGVARVAAQGGWRWIGGGGCGEGGWLDGEDSHLGSWGAGSASSYEATADRVAATIHHALPTACP
ncbi:hypothetical protein MMPV_006688 [Pyropia vietnamensis]